MASNRMLAPTLHQAAAGGMAPAVFSILASNGGSWIGWDGKRLPKKLPASGDPSVERHGSIDYIKIQFSAEHIGAYYDGFCNSVLWPALHGLTDLISSQSGWWEAYRATSAKFADTIVAHLKNDSIIWVHDYQLILVALELRRRGVQNKIGFFLHTPFPDVKVFSLIPSANVIAEGLQAYDLLGTQTYSDATNLRSVTTCFGRSCPPWKVKVFPIQISSEVMNWIQKDEVLSKGEFYGHDLILISGVDRLDYTKGIPEKISAYELLLSRRRDLVERVQLVQVAPASRLNANGYQALSAAVDELVQRVNKTYSTPNWQPIRFLSDGLAHSDALDLLRNTEIAFITPIRDGMNLVAKEFVAVKPLARPGTLVLSRTAGAADELVDAILVDPTDIAGMADALATALDMPMREKRGRLSKMKQSLERYTLQMWANEFLHALEGTARHADCHGTT